MPNPQQLITENLNIWTAAIKKRGSQGRGSSKKIELHGIKKLRELILELAVRGLLVPQNPNDEPASVLLEKIAAEKAQLIKDGKLKNQKALPEISEDEKPFKLPKGWEWSRVGDVGIGATGKTPKTSMTECFGGDIPFIGPGQITPSGRLLESEKTLTEVGIGYSTEAIVGDVLMVCIGGSIGKAVIADKRVSFNQQINALRPVISLPSYLYLALSTLTFYKQVLEKSTGSATPIINRMKWEELLAPLPPEAEQPRIVAKVDELMALCDQLEQQTEDSLTAHQTLVDTLLKSLLDAAQITPGHASSARPIQQDQNENQKDKTKSDPFQQAWKMIWENFDALFTTEHSIDQLKQTILQLAVMGKLVPQNENDEPASVLAVGEVVNFLGGYAFKSEWFQKTPGIRLLRNQNIGHGEVDWSDTEYLPEDQATDFTKFELYPGDLVLSLNRPFISTGLKLAWIREADCPCFLVQRIACLRVDPNRLLAEYLYLWCNAPNFYLEAHVVPSSGVPYITPRKVEKMEIRLPSLSEQDQIVTKVDELMALCDTLKERIRESQATQLHLADAMAEQALNE